MDTQRETEGAALAELHRSARKMAAFVAVALAAVAVLQWKPVRSAVGDVAFWRDHLRAAGPWAPLVFGFANAVLVALGAPRLALAVAAGALFGFAVGLGTAWLSAGVGAYATFLFARWGARDWARRRVRLPEGARALLLHPDAWSIVLLRQMPIIAVVQNAALGLTDVRHRVFWVGTLAGTLPSTVVAALVGGSITRETWRGSLGYLAAAMVLLALLGGWASRWGRGRRVANSVGAGRGG